MPDSSFWLTTARLGLRRFTASDLDWMAALYSDSEVTHYLGGPSDRAKVADLLDRRILQYYDQHPGLGIWMTVERRTGATIGLHNLNHLEGESCIQVGFILAKAAWGRGFGSEVALALVRYGFVDLTLSQIVGMTALNNLPAQRVLEKAGLLRKGERTFPAYASAGSQAWFERSAADWLTEHIATRAGGRAPRPLPSRVESIVGSSSFRLPWC